MKHKRIRLVLFSAWGSDYREWEYKTPVFTGMLFGIVVSLMLLGTGVVIGSKYLYLYVYDKYLERREGVLRVEYSLMQERVNGVARQYADLAGLTGLITQNVILDSTQALDGRGGAFIDEDDNIFPMFDGHDNEPDGNLYFDNSLYNELPALSDLNTSELIEQLTMRITDKRQEYNVISERFEQRRQELKHKPSIKPILDGRVTDFFGRRLDPFVRRVRHHRGLDIAAPRGTPVYAPAAGTVEMAKSRYRLNRGYGRVVIINHGYGMKTLYGHLHRVQVKSGQMVSRWDIIGSVGDTGRATGPHLHYEVWVDGKARDPVEFIINE